MIQQKGLTKKQLALSQRLLEVKHRRGRTYSEENLSTLAQKWKIGRGGVIGFVANYLENPSAWLGKNPDEIVKKKGITRGKMLSERMYDYFEVLGYQQAEISDFFTLAGKVNENYKAPERKERYSPTSLDSLEGLSERKWLLDKFKGEI